MMNLFIYGSFMKGQVNHKYLRGYKPLKATLRGYRRCWPRTKDTAILIKTSLATVTGELYFNIIEKDLSRIIRLHGIPHNYTTRKVVVTTLKDKIEYEATIFYPNDEIIKQWLLAEGKELEKKNYQVH
ncbi:MAG: gamma-glutamylcyclotransferase family protein [Candidatus Hodarchaeales archaeon]